MRLQRNFVMILGYFSLQDCLNIVAFNPCKVRKDLGGPVQFRLLWPRVFDVYRQRPIQRSRMTQKWRNLINILKLTYSFQTRAFLASPLPLLCDRIFGDKTRLGKLATRFTRSPNKDFKQSPRSSSPIMVEHENVIAFRKKKRKVKDFCPCPVPSGNMGKRDGVFAHGHLKWNRGEPF